MRQYFKNVIYVAGVLIIQGCSTFSEKPKPTSLHSAQPRQLQCLAEAIHGEARGEPEEGKIFVGRVIITRVKLGYGKNYCDVVYSKKQFAPKKKATAPCYSAAKKSIQLGPNGVTHFHSYPNRKTSSASFSQSPTCRYKSKVGGHWGFTCYEHGLRRTASIEEPILEEDTD